MYNTYDVMEKIALINSSSDAVNAALFAVAVYVMENMPSSYEGPLPQVAWVTNDPFGSRMPADDMAAIMFAGQIVVATSIRQLNFGTAIRLCKEAHTIGLCITPDKAAMYTPEAIGTEKYRLEETRKIVKRVFDDDGMWWRACMYTLSMTTTIDAYSVVAALW